MQGRRRHARSDPSGSGCPRLPGAAWPDSAGSRGRGARRRLHRRSRLRALAWRDRSVRLRARCADLRKRDRSLPRLHAARHVADRGGRARHLDADAREAARVHALGGGQIRRGARRHPAPRAGGRRGQAGAARVSDRRHRLAAKDCAGEGGRASRPHRCSRRSGVPARSPRCRVHHLPHPLLRNSHRSRLQGALDERLPGDLRCSSLFRHGSSNFSSVPPEPSVSRSKASSSGTCGAARRFRSRRSRTSSSARVEWGTAIESRGSSSRESARRP